MVNMNSFYDFESAKSYYLPIIEQYFTKQFAKIKAGKLKEAMEYGFFNGGKRLRPILTCACCEHIGLEVEKAMPFIMWAIIIITVVTLVYGWDKKFKKFIETGGKNDAEKSDGYDFLCG